MSARARRRAFFFGKKKSLAKKKPKRSPAISKSGLNFLPTAPKSEMCVLRSDFKMKKSNFHEKEKKRIIGTRFFIVFGIAFLITFILSYSTFIDTKLPDSKKVITISNMGEAHETSVSFNSMKSFFQDFLKIDTKTLGLNYEVCFVNKDTKLVYPNGEEDTRINTTVIFNNETEFNVPYSGEICIRYEIDRNFTYNWLFKATVNYTKVRESIPEKVYDNGIPIAVWATKISPNTDSYPRMDIESFVRLYLYVFVGWCAIVLLIINIYKYIVDGIDIKKEKK